MRRLCGHGESRDSHDQEKEPVSRDRGHGPITQIRRMPSPTRPILPCSCDVMSILMPTGVPSTAKPGTLTPSFCDCGHTAQIAWRSTVTLLV